MNILVIAAHPDDEVLGCGGSICKWSKKGYEVNVLILAEGITSRDSKRDRNLRESELSELEKSAKEANSILGVKSLQFLCFPDNRLDSVDLLDIIKSIEDKINELKPEMVVTHHVGDLNIDHYLIHKAVLTACRPYPQQIVKKILTFEVLSSTDWNSYTSNTTFMPNWFEDISDTLENKKRALNAYASEMKSWPHSRSIKAVEHLAKLRGASVGFDACEAFTLIRWLKN